jgi:hypothetical protein
VFGRDSQKLVCREEARDVVGAPPRRKRLLGGIGLDWNIRSMRVYCTLFACYFHVVCMLSVVRSQCFLKAFSWARHLQGRKSACGGKSNWPLESGVIELVSRAVLPQSLARATLLAQVPRCPEARSPSLCNLVILPCWYWCLSVAVTACPDVW